MVLVLLVVPPCSGGGPFDFGVLAGGCINHWIIINNNPFLYRLNDSLKIATRSSFYNKFSSLSLPDSLMDLKQTFAEYKNRLCELTPDVYNPTIPCSKITMEDIQGSILPM